MEASTVSSQLYPDSNSQQYYSDPSLYGYSSVPATQDENGATMAEAFDQRMQSSVSHSFYSTSFLGNNTNSWDDGNDWDGNLSSTNSTPPLDSGAFSTPRHSYQYPAGTSAECMNDTMPRQNHLSSTYFTSPLFMDIALKMSNNRYTSPLPSPSHSLSAFEQNPISNQTSNQLYHSMSNYPVLQGSTTGYCDMQPQDDMIMWDTMLNDSPLNSMVDQPGSYFPDLGILTPTSEFLSTESLFNSSLGDGEVKDFDGGDALQKAGFHGHDAVVELLLDNGADINARNARGKTTLHLAAQKGNQSVVKLLLEKGVDFSAKDNTGQTALHLAAKGGHRGVVRLLLNTSIDINGSDIGGHSALHLAAEQGHLGVVQILVEKGIKLNSRSNLGLTPLHRAAESGRDAVVRLLLERGADVNAKSDNG